MLPSFECRYFSGIANCCYCATAIKSEKNPNNGEVRASGLRSNAAGLGVNSLKCFASRHRGVVDKGTALRHHHHAALWFIQVILCR